MSQPKAKEKIQIIQHKRSGLKHVNKTNQNK